MGRLGFNIAAKAPVQQDAEIAAPGVEPKSQTIKTAEIYFNEGTDSKFKTMRLLVLALLVTCIFVSAFIALPQLTRLCQIDSNLDVNYKVYQLNITRLIESNQECSDKVNSLLLQLQAANERKDKLEDIPGSSESVIDSIGDSYSPIPIPNSQNSININNLLPVIDAMLEDENSYSIPSLEDDEPAIDMDDNEYK